MKKLNPTVGASEIANLYERYNDLLELKENAENIKDYFFGKIETTVTPEYKKAQELLRLIEKDLEIVKDEFQEILA